MTEGGQGPAPGQEKTAQEKILDILKGEGGLDQLEPSQLIDTTAQTSMLDGPSKMSAPTERTKLKRALTRSPRSRYHYIPTENIKFEKFLDLLFKSKMTKDEMKEEVIGYMQAVETNYNEKIKELRFNLEREKRRLKNF